MIKKKKPVFTIRDQMSARKKAALILSAAAAMAILFGAVYWLRGGSGRLPDPATIELEDAAEIMGSSAFWGMEPEDRHEYVQEAMRSFVVRTAREYAEQPPEKQEEYLENLIVRVESMSGRFSNIRPPSRPSRRSRDSEEENDDSEEASGPRSLEEEMRESRRAERRRMSGNGSQPTLARVMERMRQESERMDATSRAQVVNFMFDMGAHLRNR